MQSRMRLLLAALGFSLSFAGPLMAGDYASEISAYRRAHGLSAVKLDGRLNAVALAQARAMAASGAKRIGVASVDNPKSPYRKFWAMVITD
jgi:uncharacterized protein YkwD